jgi:hypothetical protein
VDGFDRFHVFKHCDGYPKGAAEAIGKAIPFAWEFPRFEPDQFACAFIAGNQAGTGGLRISLGPDHHGDVEYRYEIGYRSCDLWVKAFKVDRRGGPDEELYYGRLLISCHGQIEQRSAEQHRGEL